MYAEKNLQFKIFFQFCCASSNLVLGEYGVMKIASLERFLINYKQAVLVFKSIEMIP